MFLNLGVPMKTYEKILNKIQKLASKGMVNLFERTSLLVQVHNDQQFNADQKEQQQNPLATLSSYLADCPCDFLTMSHVIVPIPSL